MKTYCKFHDSSLPFCLSLPVLCGARMGCSSCDLRSDTHSLGKKTPRVAVKYLPHGDRHATRYMKHLSYIVAPGCPHAWLKNTTCTLFWHRSVAVAADLGITTRLGAARHDRRSSRSKTYKIWGFHGGDYEECRLLGYKNTVRTSQEAHYLSATEPSQLMLCKIRGFHGGDYEECRLLGDKDPVNTSQKTHYFSATEPSRIMLRKIWGLHSVGYEECRILGFDAVWHASSGWKESAI
jgi:hypothetical protein